MTPIKDEVHAIVDAQAAKGLAKYKRLLDGTPTSRSSLRDMAEEAVDLAHYALDADRQISALLEYVARLEGGFQKILDTLDEGDSMSWYQLEAVFTEILATSPLAGQQQPAPASPWRPIAEAPRDWTPIYAAVYGTKFIRMVQWDTVERKWGLLGAAGVYYDESDFTIFSKVVPAPPQEGE